MDVVYSRPGRLVWEFSNEKNAFGEGAGGLFF